MPFTFAKPHTDETPLTEPLTVEQMKERRTDDNWVKGTVVLDEDVLGYDLEEKLDAIAEALTDSCLLMDIQYDIVGIGTDEDKGSLAVEVEGDVSAIADSDEWDEDEDEEVQ